MSLRQKIEAKAAEVDTSVLAQLQVPSAWPRPSIGHYGPRVVRESKSGKVGSAVVAGIAMLTLLIGTGVYSKMDNDRKLLLSEGKVVDARIIDLDKDDDSRYVTYNYTWNGQVVQRRNKVNKSFYRSHSRGDTIPITIASQHPSLRRIGEYGQREANAEASEGILITGVLFGLFGLMWLGMRASARKNMQILMDWPATTGQIVEAKSVSGQHGKSYSIKYRFQARGEPMLIKQARFDATRKPQPVVGSYVDVVYNPEKPSQAWILPQLSMAEIDDGGIR